MKNFSINCLNGPKLQIRFLNLKVNLSLNYLSWAGPSNLGSKWLKIDLKMCSMASLDANDVMDSAFCRQNFTLYSKTINLFNPKIWTVVEETANFGIYGNQLATFYFIKCRKLCCCHFCLFQQLLCICLEIYICKESNMYDFWHLREIFGNIH